MSICTSLYSAWINKEVLPFQASHVYSKLEILNVLSYIILALLFIAHDTKTAFKQVSKNLSIIPQFYCQVHTTHKTKHFLLCLLAQNVLVIQIWSDSFKQRFTLTEKFFQSTIWGRMDAYSAPWLLLLAPAKNNFITTPLTQPFFTIVDCIKEVVHQL